MARPRARAALLAGALLAAMAPVVAQAVSTHLSCGVKQTNRWETIPVRAFKDVSGLTSSDVVSAYTVDKGQPQDVAATNGVRIQLSKSHGCAWSDSFALSPTPSTTQPFAGATAKIVSLGLLNGRVLAAVQEGSGSASRPHVLVSADGTAGSFTTSDNGLPAQGAPRLLRVAADNRTAYLTISPTATGGSDSTVTGPLPLPGGTGASGTPTGFLYRTSDGGANWTLQTGAGDLPGGGTGFTQLDIDAGDSNRLYGIVGERLLVSRNGGATFTARPDRGYTAVTAMGPLSVVAFNASGGHLSSNGGTSFTDVPAPSGITSAAFRNGASALAIESSGTLRLLEVGNGALTSVPASGSARIGSLLGDRGAGSSYHALSGHALLRYVDPVPPGVYVPAPAIGDLTVPPPKPGVVSPAVRTVTLPVGSSSVEDFTLALPKNRTPLDLFFLIDVSSGMSHLIENLKQNLRNIVRDVNSEQVQLRVGVGIVGSGPTRSEQPYPVTYVYPPQVDPDHPDRTKPGPAYTKPVLYRLIRAVGDTGPNLQKAINQVTIETVPDDQTGTQYEQSHEAQLIALKNLATGRGTHTLAEEQANLNTYSEVPPGQEGGFRDNPGVRHVVILATNEKMDAPYGEYPMGTDEMPGSDTQHNPTLNFAPTIAMLKKAQLSVIGLTVNDTQAEPDLKTIARGTGALAPPGGVVCDDGRFSGTPVTISAGAPLVCNNADHFSEVISRVLGSLVDRQSVQVVPHRRTPVLGALDGRGLLGLDMKKPNRAAFQVRVSCIDVKPGHYQQDVDAVLRQTVVGTARVNVTCVKAAAFTRPKPLMVGNPPPPPAQPIANVVVPVAPPPPAAQPQVQPQVQTQVQVQPLTAAAIQEQQELQLALALNGTYKEDDPIFSAGQQLAMVDRRRREEVQALGVLAFAITACAGVGLARLRSKPEIGVRRAR